MEKKAIGGKKRARTLALQALYQWQLSGTALSEIEAQFRAIKTMDKVDVAYFCRLLHDIPAQVTVLESAFSPFLDRGIKELNPIELTVLRMGSFELLFCPEVPYKVVLNEAIALTKSFGSQDGHKYVNGVLHNVAKKVRSLEIGLEHG